MIIKLLEYVVGYLIEMAWLIYHYLPGAVCQVNASNYIIYKII